MKGDDFQMDGDPASKHNIFIIKSGKIYDKKDILISCYAVAYSR